MRVYKIRQLYLFYPLCPTPPGGRGSLWGSSESKRIPAQAITIEYSKEKGTFCFFLRSVIPVVERTRMSPFSPRNREMLVSPPPIGYIHGQTLNPGCKKPCHISSFASHCSCSSSSACCCLPTPRHRTRSQKRRLKMCSWRRPSIHCSRCFASDRAETRYQGNKPAPGGRPDRGREEGHPSAAGQAGGRPADDRLEPEGDRGRDGHRQPAGRGGKEIQTAGKAVFAVQARTERNAGNDQSCPLLLYPKDDCHLRIRGRSGMS